MKISTIENIGQRFVWLQDVLDGRVKLQDSQLEKMFDMRAFCSLEVTKRFDKISYNTLKKACLHNSAPDVNHRLDNQWEHIKALRNKIHLAYSKKEPGNNAITKPTENMKINEAFNQAQLASIAYLDLFKFIKTILESDLTLNEATKLQISNYLFESSQKFESITSFTSPPPKAWSVIQGGKGNV